MSYRFRSLGRFVAVLAMVSVAGILAPALGRRGADDNGSRRSRNSRDHVYDDSRGRGRDDSRGRGYDDSRDRSPGNSYGNRKDDKVVVLYGQPVDVERHWFVRAEASGLRHSFSHRNVFWYGTPRGWVLGRTDWRPWNQGRGPR